MKNALFVWIAIFMLVQFSCSEAREPLGLRYIANEGVMLTSGRVSVLIDAVFDDSNKNYRAPSPELMEKMIAGDAPFESVSYVLVTHNHPDHFTPGLAVRFLENHPETMLIGPSDAVETMKSASDDWPSLEPRVIAFDLEIGERAEHLDESVSITAHRTRHSGNRTDPMNLVYLLELNGWHIIHEGDSDGQLATFEDMGLGDIAIDLALVHFWFPLDEGATRILKEVIKPAHIGLIHLPISWEEEGPSKIEAVRGEYDDMFLLTPDSAPRIIR